MKISLTKIKIIIIAFIVVFTFMPLMAGDEKDAESYLKANLDKVFNVLKNTSLDQDKKTSEIVNIVSPMFDFELITKLSFGRKHWTGMTKDRQNQFVTLFIKLLKKSFIEKLTLYSDEKIIVKNSISTKNKVEIPTILVAKDQEYKMSYKFYKSKNNGWKIYDLEIQDISVVKTYQTQIDQVLEKGTYDDLLIKLEKSE